MKSASTTRAVCVQLSCWSLSFGLLSLAVAVFWMQRWLPDSKVLPSVLAQLFDSRDVVFATVRNLAIVVGLHLALGVAWCSLWRPLDARWCEKRAATAPQRC